MVAEAIGDVGADEGLVAAEAERRSDLLEVVDDVIGQAERDQGHGLVGLHVALDAFTHLHSVSFRCFVFR